MALKDWKNYKKDSWFKEYRRGNKSYVHMFNSSEHDLYYNMSYQREREKKIGGVIYKIIVISDGNWSQKFFKNKISALKYARSYMRKH